MDLISALFDYVLGKDLTTKDQHVMARLVAKNRVMWELIEAANISEITTSLRRDRPIPQCSFWSKESLKVSM